jgi:hypothetical protein
MSAYRDVTCMVFGLALPGLEGAELKARTNLHNAGRTLASSEAWALFGGEYYKCSTTLGRCYAWPMDCDTYIG